MIQNVGLSDPGTWFDGLLELFEDLNKTSRQSHTKVCTEFVHLPSRLPGRLDLNSAQLRYSCHDSLQQGWASAESWSFPHRHGILARRFKDSHCLDFWALASNGWNFNHIEFFSRFLRLDVLHDLEKLWMLRFVICGLLHTCRGFAPDLVARLRTSGHWNTKHRLQLSRTKLSHGVLHISVFQGKLLQSDSWSEAQDISGSVWCILVQDLIVIKCYQAIQRHCKVGSTCWTRGCGAQASNLRSYWPVVLAASWTTIWEVWECHVKVKSAKSGDQLEINWNLFYKLT